MLYSFIRDDYKNAYKVIKNNMQMTPLQFSKVLDAANNDNADICSTYTTSLQNLLEQPKLQDKAILGPVLILAAQLKEAISTQKFSVPEAIIAKAKAGESKRATSKRIIAHVGLAIADLAAAALGSVLLTATALAINHDILLNQAILEYSPQNIIEFFINLDYNIRLALLGCAITGGVIGLLLSAIGMHYRLATTCLATFKVDTELLAQLNQKTIDLVEKCLETKEDRIIRKNFESWWSNIELVSAHASNFNPADFVVEIHTDTSLQQIRAPNLWDRWDRLRFSLDQAQQVQTALALTLPALERIQEEAKDNALANDIQLKINEAKKIVAPLEKTKSHTRC